MSPTAVALILLLVVAVFVRCVGPPFGGAPAGPPPPFGCAVYEAPPVVSAAAPQPVAVLARHDSTDGSPFDRLRCPGMHWIWADGSAHFDPDRMLIRGPEPVTLVKVIVNDSNAEVDAVLGAQCHGDAEVAFNGVVLASGGDRLRVPITIRRGRNEIRARVRSFALEWEAGGGFACAVWGRGPTGLPIVVTNATWGWCP